MTDLTLSDNGINDGAIAALAGSPVVGKLKRLLLCDNDIDESGIVSMTRSPHLSVLEWLDSSGNALSTGALRALIAAPGWWGLRKLRLGRQQVTAQRLLGELRGRFGTALTWG